MGAAAGGHRTITLRCPRRRHGEVEPGATGHVRVYCRHCRQGPGEVVWHRFDLATGDCEAWRLAHPRRYADNDDDRAPGSAVG